MRTIESDVARAVSVDGGPVSGSTHATLDGTHSGGSDACMRPFNRRGEVEWTGRFAAKGAEAARAIRVNSKIICVVGAYGCEKTQMITPFVSALDIDSNPSVLFGGQGSLESSGNADTRWKLRYSLLSQLRPFPTVEKK